MSTRIALLRGVNVGGAGKLPMAAFRDLLTGMGLHRVETYIQSGNAVFESDLAAPDLEAMIRGGIATRFGFAPETFVLGAHDLAAALHDHPFAGVDPRFVHVFFLKAPPQPDLAALRALARPAGDAWHLAPRRFTLLTPGGFGTSKLAEVLPRYLPKPMTARNLRTVAALQAMVAARGAPGDLAQA
ncbi:MAG: DUF1697 domain-containing protein [Tabrizicola sp.]|jgi:uncharacterized protein (DUF1697 family)|nr:DUF1697 domain-containing protein [Tabrizicola sp.]